MKRRYKAGDWFAVPLDVNAQALGIITHACRSRLFGYFFAAHAGRRYSHDDLKALRPEDACARMLFGGAPIEELRWPLVAASLHLNEARWALPVFGERGAFGRSWSRRVFDPRTLEAIAREPASADDVRLLPPAHFAGAGEIEALLREVICGVPRPAASIVCELRLPIDRDSLAVLDGGGRVQVSQPLAEGDVAALFSGLKDPSHVELRIHALYGEPFDLRVLRNFPALRSLRLDTPNVAHLQALGDVRALQRLHVSGGLGTRLRETGVLKRLRALTVRGDVDWSALENCAALEELGVAGESPADLAALRALPLASLTLAHTAGNLRELAELRALQALELRGVQLPQLPDLSQLRVLHSLHLHGVRLLRDLRPLAAAPALKDVAIEAMPQLQIGDFAPLCTLARIAHLEIDVGNRTLNREIYRMLAREKKEHEI